MNLDEILNKFLWGFSVMSFPQVKISPLGSGHIHETFQILFSGNSTKKDKKFVLQKINHSIFKDVDGMMMNIKFVTDHLKNKYTNSLTRSHEWQTLSLVSTVDERLYYEDTCGSCWRCFEFIDNSKSYDLVTTDLLAYQGGLALGRFQADLMDLDPTQLTEVLPDFHHVQSRFHYFKESINQNLVHRKQEVAEEIQKLSSRIERMSEILKWGQKGILPLRITHNDTKFNNILLNESDHAIAMIDLDTVMPGYVAYDFGDAIRTIINNSPEDEVDPNKIQLQLSYFESFTKGYLSQVKSFLTPIEVKSLSKGVLLLPYLQSLRFLTDYLNGDTYFKINHEKHNLQRSRAQLRLVELLEDNEKIIDAIIIKNTYGRPVEM